MSASKAEALQQRFGNQMAESMGENRRPPAWTQPRPVAGPDRDLGLSRDKSALMIDVERIMAVEQVRTEFDAERIEELRASIEEYGQLQPISVRWDEGHGKYVVVTGERRFRALCLAGKKQARVTMDEVSEQNPERIGMVQLVENLVRADLAPMEQARAFRREMDGKGLSAEALARQLSISEAKVLRSLALIDLPESVQDLVATGTVTPTLAYEISKAPEDRREDVARRVVAQDLTVAETARVVAEVRQAEQDRPMSAEQGGTTGAGKKSPRIRTTKHPARAKLETFRVFKGQGGLKLTAERAKGIEPAALLTILETAAAEVRAELDSAGGSGE